VNLLIGTNGNVLRNECSGQVMMKTQLSGMPECKFALNDKLNMEKENGGKSDDKRRAVEIDDCTFHRCVRLGKFDSERTITFVPPDGEFELMKYRVNGNISLPFKLMPAVQEDGKKRVTLTLKVTANFGTTKSASNVVVRFPVPPNTARATVKVGAGRAKFEPEQKAIVWRIKKFNGGQEFMMSAEVDLMETTVSKTWSRPPISVDFNVSMFTASGVYVRYLRVFDKSGYHTHRWVRYMTRAGEYQVRI
jgi:AP-2 complex subunit mu-1